MITKLRKYLRHKNCQLIVVMPKFLTHTFSFSLATKRLMIMLCQALACWPTAIRNKQFEHAHRESYKDRSRTVLGGSLNILKNQPMFRIHESKAPRFSDQFFWLFLFWEQWLCNKLVLWIFLELVSARAHTLVDNWQVSVPDSKNHPTLVEDNFCYTCMKGGYSEPAAPTSAPSTGCPLLLSCGWTKFH
jgi:hypothetical protein